MTQMGYCILLDKNELEFQYNDKTFIIEKINVINKTFLLKDIPSPISIEIFFRNSVNEFFDYVEKNYPEKLDIKL